MTHLTARGQSHRGAPDPFVPEIGDEVAVARAPRHLADQLLDTAAQEVATVTGSRRTCGPADTFGQGPDYPWAPGRDKERPDRAQGICSVDVATGPLAHGW